MFVFREPRCLTAVYYRATDDLLFALKMACEGVGIDLAAQLSGLDAAAISRMWQRALDIGLVQHSSRAIVAV